MTKLLPAFAYDESTSVIEDVPGATGALVVPDGNKDQRPTTPANGMVRYNNTTTGYRLSQFEAYENGTWARMIGEPIDPSVVWLHDDFIGVLSGTTLLSEMTWITGVINVSPPTASYQAVDPPQHGVIRWQTVATNGEGYVLFPHLARIGNFSANVPWELHWIFRLNSTSDVKFRIGLTSGSLAVPTDGIFLRHDNLPDTTWWVESRVASVSQSVDTMVGANTSFHKIRIRSLTAGTIIFNLDSGDDITIPPPAPSTRLLPAAHCVTAGGVKSVDYDLFTFRLRGVGR